MFKTILMSSAHKITEATATISTSATKLSKIMDTAGGGPDAYGGFHRIFGGHDFWDLDMWSRHGLDFPKELLKDFITPNGLPLPGVKEAIEKLGVPVQTAQEWGCVNIGEFMGGGLSIVDSAMKIKKYTSGNTDDEIESSEYISLLIKCAIATGTTNPLLAASALSDCTLLMKRSYDQSFQNHFNYVPLHSED
jgi:hypothetical protein